MHFAAFRKKIWAYYRAHRRDLPWRPPHLPISRGIADPYAIVVSEIMLQQTQVSRVLQKYKEFLRNFRNFKSLAAAPASRVLKAWQGLGYNRRALNLKRLAEVVVREHGGTLPQGLADLEQLPGIGKATAGSIAAFAFNAPAAFIETNIRRAYLHEFFRDHANVSDAAVLRLVEKTMGRKNPREWYYALMDYGAMLGRMPTLKNPNRRSARYRTQSKFEGSKRQTRGAVLRALLDHGGLLTVRGLTKQVGKSAAALTPILADLSRERFVTVRRGRVALAE